MVHGKMNLSREEVLQAIEVMKAFVDGKKIEYAPKDTNAYSDCEYPNFDFSRFDYRIKKCYRPFISVFELMEGRFCKNGNLIYVKSKETGDIFLIFEYFVKTNHISIANRLVTMEKLFEEFTFLDGSPCGILE